MRSYACGGREDLNLRVDGAGWGSAPFDWPRSLTHLATFAPVRCQQMQRLHQEPVPEREAAERLREERGGCSMSGGRM